MAESVIKELSDISECAVCLSSATSPKVLPCQHGFCLACLQGVYHEATKRNRSTVGQLTCPVCNTVAPILAGDLTKLPNDFRTGQVAAALGNLKKASSASNCYSCSKNKLWTVAQVLCFDCTKVFCTDCHKKHIANKRFNSHVYTNLTEDGIDELRCSEHSEFFHMFCLDCTKGICQVCMLTAHADHTMEVFTPSDGTPLCHNVNLKQAKTDLVRLSSRNSEILKEFQHHVQTIKGEIRENKLALFKKLDDEELELYAQLNTGYTDFERISNGMAHDFKTKLVKLEDLENKDKIIQLPLPKAPAIKLAVTSFPSTVQTADIMRTVNELTLPTAPKYKYTERNDGFGTLFDPAAILEATHNVTPMKLTTDQKDDTNMQSKELTLHKTENPWKARERKQEIFYKLRSILNKLTPQRFQKLLSQVIVLGINTEEKLVGTAEIIWETAVNQPQFSNVYANLCRCLSNLEVVRRTNREECVLRFRKFILNRCQKEFQHTCVELNVEIHGTTSGISPNDDMDLKATEQASEEHIKKRYLGNIRLIGELFKLRLITECIVHECLLQLLRAKNEYTLELFCSLLTLVGKDLDTKNSEEKVDRYFTSLNELVASRKHPAKTRFVMLDVIDLRKNKWVPRRPDDGPKTISVVRKKWDNI